MNELAPHRAPEFTKGQLEKAFPSGSYVLGITAVHGIEPILIAASIGLKINEELLENNITGKPIVLPAIYGPKIEGVLKDEYPAHLQDQLFLSDDLAEILTLTEFRLTGYQDHLQRVVLHQGKVKDRLKQFLSKPFTVRSVKDNKRMTIHPDQKPIEINAGANVTATPEAHSVFPVRFSDLIQLIKKTPRLYELYDPEVIRKTEEIAKKMEEDHKTTQLPHHHTLIEEDWFDPQGKIIFIPHLKEPKSPPEEVDTSSEKGGVYINISGAGMGEVMAKAQGENLAREGYTVLAPDWLNWDFTVPSGPQALYLKTPEGEPFIKVFIMRPGYGSIWHAIEAEVGIGYTPSNPYENPEMTGNERGIESFGFGRVFSPRQDMIELFNSAPSSIRTYKERMYKELNLPYGTSGIKTAADNIIRSEIGNI